jgi:2-octaprenylphenol hydroxylase
MKGRFSIVVAGAGMVGLTVAALLARSRHGNALDITVCDAGTRPAYDADDDVGLRVSAVSLGSSRLLEGLDVWRRVAAARMSAFSGMRVWDAREQADGPGTLCFDAADFAVPELGFIVENALIRDALLEVLAETRVDLRFSTALGSVSAREAGGFELELEDGQRLSPDLLVGADGAESRVRKGASIPVRAWQYPQHAFVTHVRPERPHRDIAWQRFLRDGPIALLPLADGRSSIVWSTAPERVASALEADDEALAEMLTSASDAVLGRLAVAGPRGSFPLRAQHALRYVEPGLALVGDAAHSVHPLAGQGANLGFADAAALADAIGGALDRGEYPGDLPTLRRFERTRRGANATMLHFIDSLNRLFASERGLLAGLRSRGMRVFNRSGPIRRRAVQVALGINV